MPPKVQKKAAAKTAKAPAKTKAKSSSVVGLKTSSKPVTKSKDSDEIKAVVMLVFTKCNGAVSLLIGKESYEKWGAPGGGLNPSEKLEDACKRIFQTEIGHPMFTSKHSHSFRYKNAQIFMFYTEECIKEEFGPNVKQPSELLELKHVPVSTLYKFIDSPNLDKPLRAIFISMMVECKPQISSFVDKCK